MKYLNSAEMAQKWNISDRRIRTLAKDGRIEGAKKEGKSYLIPENAIKPMDLRFRDNEAKFRYTASISFYLKWQDEVVGIIDKEGELQFINPNYNSVISIYSQGSKYWTQSQVLDFLSRRIIDPSRRDIEQVLHRLGLKDYNVIEIAKKTKAINAKDLLWITEDEKEEFNQAITDVFNSVFLKSLDAKGDSIDTPEGNNIKRYGVYNGKYGIYKERISPLSMDLEAELAVYELAKLLGVPCCNVYRIDKDTIFSEFAYDFAKEYIVHFRHIVDHEFESEYQNLISSRPNYQKDFIKMIALDFITRQDDRHLSNVAIKISGQDESFYPLYDNGRALFFEDTKETVGKAVLDLKNYSTGFGFFGTYYDYISEIANNGVDFNRILNLNISDKEIKDILVRSGFTDYRLDGAALWISKALELLRNI